MSTVFEDVDQHVYAELPQCPKPLRIQMIREVIIDFCHRTRCWFVDSDELTITSGVDEYDFSDWVPAEGVEIDAIAEVWWHDRLLQPITDYLIKNKTTIVLTQTPTSDDDDALWIRQVLRPTHETLDIDDEGFCRIKSDWMVSAWAPGVLARLMRQQRKPWSSPDWREYRLIYENRVREAKEEYRRRFTPANIRTSPSIPFVRTFSRQGIAR